MIVFYNPDTITWRHRYLITIIRAENITLFEILAKKLLFITKLSTLSMFPMFTPLTLNNIYINFLLFYCRYDIDTYLLYLVHALT